MRKSYYNVFAWVLGLAAAVWLMPSEVCGGDGPATAQWRYRSVVFQSRAGVYTWEKDGVRVFVAEGDAEIRQGPVRLFAPRMVVWFDINESSKPHVRAACLRVYAEGVGTPGMEPSLPVRVVEGDRAKSYGAVFMRFRSKQGFVWDCPRNREGAAEDVPFFQKALDVTGEAREGFTLDLIPEGPPARPVEKVPQILKSNETHIFTDPERKKVTVVYLGDVRGRYENVDLRADAAVLWVDEETEAFEIYARGDVRLSRGAEAPQPSPGGEAGLPEILEAFQNLRADEVYIHPRRERGLASKAEVRLKGKTEAPWDVYVFTGKKIYLLDSDNLYVKEGSATSCPFGDPHYRLQADRMAVSRVGESTFLTAWDASLRLGETERRLLPFIGLDLTRESYLLRSVEVGSSNKFGPFARTVWRLGDLMVTPQWLDRWEVNLDYYSDRGPAVGTEIGYDLRTAAGHQHAGDITAYYVKDTKDADATGLPVPDEDRGRFRVQHRTEWNEHWRTDLEYYYLSDAGFLDEYFEEEFEEEKLPESYIFLRYRKDSTWAGVLFKGQVNDFLPQLEEKPSAEIRWIGLPLSGWVYEGGLVAGLYDVEPSSLLAAADPPQLYRIHTEHKLSRPFSMGAIRFDPYVQVLGTTASKGAPVGGSYSGSQQRFGIGGGIYASTDFSRSYDVSSKLLKLNRLRHIITPYVAVETLHVTGEGSADFVQMDEIDAIDNLSQFSAGIRQRLQTKRGGPGAWKTVNFVMLDVDFVSRSSDSVTYMGDDRFVEVDLIVRLTDRITLHSLDNRLSLSGGTDVVNLGASMDFSPAARLILDYDQISDVSSAVSAELLCRLSDRWTLGVLERCG